MLIYYHPYELSMMLLELPVMFVSLLDQAITIGLDGHFAECNDHDTRQSLAEYNGHGTQQSHHQLLYAFFFVKSCFAECPIKNA